jgi:hypothetical protein
MGSWIFLLWVALLHGIATRTLLRGLKLIDSLFLLIGKPSSLIWLINGCLDCARIISPSLWIAEAFLELEDISSLLTQLTHKTHSPNMSLVRCNLFGRQVIGLHLLSEVLVLI